MKKKIYYIILIIIILEICLFNFQSLKSYILNYGEINTNANYKYYVKNKYHIVEVNLKDINTKVYNIYIDYNTKRKNSFEESVTLNYTDGTFKNYKRYYGQDKELKHFMSSKNNRSKYIKCEFIGNAEKMKLKIVSCDKIKINNIILNKKVPFNFSFIRVAFLSIVSCSIYLLFSCKFFKKDFDIKDRYQSIFLMGIYAAFIVLLFLIQFNIGNNEVWKNNISSVYSIDFVNSLKQGRVNIDISDKVINKIENQDQDSVYSFVNINSKGLNGVFDTAYYNGNIYIYYGILPALILLLPINLITGQYLSVMAATFIFLTLGSIFTVKLIKEIINRYFKKVPFSLVVVLTIFVLFNNRLIYLISRPFVYELVISAGYFFVTAGLYLFFKYLRKDKIIYLVLSSLLLALAVACRPPTILVSIITVSLLTYNIVKKYKEDIKSKSNSKDDKIKNKREVKKKILYKYLKTVLIASIPYIIVGILLMVYNYVRFHNIFEFGANYQLSVIDFRKFGFSINRIIIGLTDYFFGPVNLIPNFPFITSTVWNPEYFGYYFSLPVGGGYFLTSFLGIIILFIPLLWKKIKKHNAEMALFVLISTIVAVIIATLEANKCGSLGRYLVDFTWLLNISVILITILLFNELKTNDAKNNILKILVIVILVSCIVNTLMIYSNEASLLKTRENIRTFYYIKHLICFWL